MDALGPSPTVDRLGLSTVLLLGFALGRRTVIEGIEACSRDADGRVRGNAADPDAYLIDPAPRPPTDDELLEMLLDATRREAGGVPPLLMLSGGRDSRLILLALRSVGFAPPCVMTTGSLPDRRIARALAERFGWPVREIEPLAFDAGRLAARHEAQSFSSLEHEWMEGCARAARATGLPITDGIGAGVLPTGSLLKPEAVALWRERRFDELARWVLGHANGAGPGFHDRLARAGVPLATSDEVMHELVRTFRSLERYPNPLGAFSLLHWTGRGIASSAFGLLGHDRRVVAPLLDRRLCEGLLAFDLASNLASDWRERLLRRLDDTGIPHSVDDGSRRRSMFRSALSALRWRRFVRTLPRPLAELATLQDAVPGVNGRFVRSAIGLVVALERRTSGAAGRPSSGRMDGSPR